MTRRARPEDQILADMLDVLQSIDFLDGVPLTVPHYANGERVVMRPVTSSDVVAGLNTDILPARLYYGDEAAP